MLLNVVWKSLDIDFWDFVSFFLHSREVFIEEFISKIWQRIFILNFKEQYVARTSITHMIKFYLSSKFVYFPDENLTNFYCSLRQISRTRSKEKFQKSSILGSKYSHVKLNCMEQIGVERSYLQCCLTCLASVRRFASCLEGIRSWNRCTITVLHETFCTSV